MQRVAILDYGMGNLHSVSKALERVASSDVEIFVTAEERLLKSADRLVVPGVGGIRDCMAEIKRLGFDELILQWVAAGRPLLGICIGMQILLAHSAENEGVDGLALFPETVQRFPDPKPPTLLKVPHMGWNQVWQSSAHPMWQGIADGERFYFVHSYYAAAAGQHPDVAGWCDYGLRFAAALKKDNLFAVQFHPEKSQKAGLALLANFLTWQPEAAANA